LWQTVNTQGVHLWRRADGLLSSLGGNASNASSWQVYAASGVPLRLRLQLKTGGTVLAGAGNGTYELHNEV
jgi:hypothetical protein